MSTPQFNTGHLQAKPGATGFLEQIRIDGTTICDIAGKNGFTGVCLNAFLSADPGELFPVTGQTVAGQITGVDVSGDETGLVLQTHASAGQLNALYDIRIAGQDDRLTLNLSVDVTGSGWLASLGLALPLIVGGNPLQRRTTVGGAHRNEVWRLDQNDEPDTEEWLKKVSDTRARWPLWRIGGITVDAPHQYTIWKSSDHTTPAMPMEQGTGCPGWISYTDQNYTLRVAWKDMQASPPAAMTVDGEHGILWVWLHPPSIRPVRVKGAYRRTIALEIECSVNYRL